MFLRAAYLGPPDPSTFRSMLPEERAFMATPLDEPTPADAMPLTSPDALPAYTRKPPPVVTSYDDPESTYPTREHVLSSKSGRVSVTLNASGANRIILVQRHVNGGVDLDGVLKLNFKQPESVDRIQIKLKAMVRTLVMKAHGSGRHHLRDDQTLYEEAHLFYSDSAPVKKYPIPPGNIEEGTGRLKGEFSFPFKFTVPTTVTVKNPRRPDATPRTIRLPPSCVLNTSSSGDISLEHNSGTEWASCRYFVKVTVARKGLLKQNERLYIPLIYVPKQNYNSMSPLRLKAMIEGVPSPGPEKDPSGWVCKTNKFTVNRGVFQGKKAPYLSHIYLPSPAQFTRRSTIPFVLKIRSCDPQLTGDFPPSAISCMLLQRAFVSAQTVTTVHDSILAQGLIREFGPPGGRYLADDEVEDGMRWERTYRGAIPLSRFVGVSFRTVNLSVQHLLLVGFTLPGLGNNAEASHLVDIISSTRTVFPFVTPAAVLSGSSSRSNLTEPIPIPGPSTSSPIQSSGSLPSRFLRKIYTGPTANTPSSPDEYDFDQRPTGVIIPDVTQQLHSPNPSSFAGIETSTSLSAVVSPNGFTDYEEDLPPSYFEDFE